MKFFRILLNFHFIILISNYSYILNTSISNINDNKNNISLYSDNIISENSKKKLSNEICSIKNCLECEYRNKCIKCKDGFELYKKRCYAKNCGIYGFCQFCDEYDCLKCQKGYKLIYGICEEKEVSKNIIIFIIFSTLMILILIIYISIRHKKLSKLRIATGQIIKYMHPKSGFYKLNYEVNNKIEDTSKNKILGSSLGMNVENSSIEKSDSPVVNYCVACKNINKKVYTIADCGCSICFDHYKLIKKEKNIICSIHKVVMNSSITFTMEEKSNIKGNALEKLGLKKCPICKINNGTQSFNCGCQMKVCEKCFYDNVYVFKYKECPGCGEVYVANKNNKKKIKSKNEKVINGMDKENGKKSNGQ